MSDQQNEDKIKEPSFFADKEHCGFRYSNGSTSFGIKLAHNQIAAFGAGFAFGAITGVWLYKKARSN